MGLWEAIKDTIGILDDAGDYIDKAERHLNDAKEIFRKLDKVKIQTPKLIEAASKQANIEDVILREQTFRFNPGIIENKDVEALMEEAGFTQFIFFSSDIKSRLYHAQKELLEARRKLDRAPDDIKEEVGDKIDKALDYVMDKHDEYDAVITKIGVLQSKMRGEILRFLSVAAILVGVGALAVYAGDLAAKRAEAASRAGDIASSASNIDRDISDAKGLFGASRKLDLDVDEVTRAQAHIKESRGVLGQFMGR